MLDSRALQELSWRALYKIAVFPKFVERYLKYSSMIEKL